MHRVPMHISPGDMGIAASRDLRTSWRLAILVTGHTLASIFRVCDVLA
jgi:hypothetical protein